MDGVVADYDMLDYKIHGEEKDVYLTKRPIKTVINILEKISTLDNVNIYILSISRYKRQINGKKIWLSKYMPFINTKNIKIISREEKNQQSAATIKCNYLLENIKDKNSVNIHIDDSHNVLRQIDELDKDITPLHISSILD
jgi:5'(3')-deoxyribonucleotidase